MELKFNELKHRAYRIACEHGWYDKETTPTHEISLIMSEVGEAVNAERAGKHAQRAMFLRESVTPQPNSEKHWAFCFNIFIKDSVEDELADVAIRILSFAGKCGFTFIESCLTDEYIEKCIKSIEELKHVTFPQECFVLYSSLIDFFEKKIDITYLLFNVLVIAKKNKIDLMWHIEQKMKYNELRPYRHGRKF